jgi:hypothetical protein
MQEKARSQRLRASDCQKTPNTGEANSFPRGEGGQIIIVSATRK